MSLKNWNSHNTWKHLILKWKNLNKTLKILDICHLNTVKGQIEGKTWFRALELYGALSGGLPWSSLRNFSRSSWGIFSGSPRKLLRSDLRNFLRVTCGIPPGWLEESPQGNLRNFHGVTLETTGLLGGLPQGDLGKFLRVNCGTFPGKPVEFRRGDLRNCFGG